MKIPDQTRRQLDAALLELKVRWRGMKEAEELLVLSERRRKEANDALTKARERLRDFSGVLNLKENTGTPKYVRSGEDLVRVLWEGNCFFAELVEPKEVDE